MWRFYVHETITGNRIEEVHPVSGRWVRRLNGRGDGSHSFVLADDEFTQTEWRAMFTPNSRVLVVAWNDTPVYAGLISETTYHFDTGTVAVSHKELRALFAARLTFGVNVYPQGDLAFTGKSASGAVRAILARAVQWSSEWDLPITLPSDGSGSLSKSWKRYQVHTIEDCLSEIEAEGWEIDFRPTFSGTALRWVVTVGKPIVRGLEDFNLTAPECPLEGVSVSLDGSEQLTGVFVSGNGTGADIVTAWAGNAGANTIPIRDAARTGGQERDTAVLGRIAAAYLEEFDTPLVRWSFTASLSDDVSPAVFLPGERVALVTHGDLWVADGSRTVRCIALSGDMSWRVRPEVG